MHHENEHRINKAEIVLTSNGKFSLILLYCTLYVQNPIQTSPYLNLKANILSCYIINVLCLEERRESHPTNHTFVYPDSHPSISRAKIKDPTEQKKSLKGVCREVVTMIMISISSKPRKRVEERQQEP
jgi:hypothetical protein